VLLPVEPALVPGAAGGVALLSPMVPVLPGWSRLPTSPLVLELCFWVFLLWVVVAVSPEPPEVLSVWVLVLELS